MDLKKTRQLLDVLSKRLSQTVEYDTGALSESISLRLRIDSDMGDWVIVMDMQNYWKWICHFSRSNRTPVPADAFLELDASKLEDYSGRGGKNYLPLSSSIQDILNAIQDDFSNYVEDGIMNSFGRW